MGGAFFEPTQADAGLCFPKSLNYLKVFAFFALKVFVLLHEFIVRLFWCGNGRVANQCTIP